MNERGFSLIEMAIVVLVLGLSMAIAVAGFHSLSDDQKLKGAAQDVAGQVQLARARAMSTGATQTLNFDAASNPRRVFIVGSGGSRRWSLPQGIGFATGGANSFDVTSDGRVTTSQYIVLQNAQGRMDTISVQTSGLVIAR